TPRTTTRQVNPPAGWQRDRSDLAYNDEVTPQSAAPLRGLPTRQVVTGTGLAPAREVVPQPAGPKHVRPRRPCHSRATSGGQPWHRADNHGHTHPTDRLAI